MNEKQVRAHRGKQARKVAKPVRDYSTFFESDAFWITLMILVAVFAAFCDADFICGR